MVETSSTSRCVCQCKRSAQHRGDDRPQDPPKQVQEAPDMLPLGAQPSQNSRQQPRCQLQTWEQNPQPGTCQGLNVHWLRRFRQLIECRRCTLFAPKLSVARLLAAAVDAVLEVPLAGLRCSRLVEQVFLQRWGLARTFGGSVAATSMTMLVFLAGGEIASFRRCSRSAQLVRDRANVQGAAGSTAGDSACR